MSYPAASTIRRRLPVDNRQQVLVEDQELNHIIKAIKKYHLQHRNNYDAIAEDFWTGDPKSTCQNLFKYLKQNVRYHVEPEHDQTIKSPGRIMQEGYGDCKHYSSFINGVIDSLHRKGYPVNCCYRFVSDVPGKDVHHVFAVVNSPAGTFWVDPVLSSFDQRPQFHNTHDINFSQGIHGIGRLTYLSGTDFSDAEIGKINFKKALQDIKKGAHNTQKKVQHATKQVQKGAQNTAKKVQKTAEKVAHVAVKVATTPGRNAVLALLDINAFNLAARVANSPNKPGLYKKWKELGGDPAKLQQAARNGLLFQAKLHKKNPAAVKGLGGCIGMGVTYHSDMITTHPHRWVQDHYNRKHRRVRRNAEGSMVAGSMVGLEPVSTSSLMALAAGILALLGQYLGNNHQEKMAMAQQAKQGGMDIADMAANADQAQGQYKAQVMDNITTPQPGADASMSVQTGIDETGNPEVVVQDVRHPALNNAGTADGGAGSDVVPYTDPAKPAGPGFFDNIEQKVKDTWTNHKGMVIGTGVVVIALSNKKIRKKIGLA